MAARGRAMTAEEAGAFSKLNQDKRNQEVKALADKAGWKTREVIGTDAKSYTAFCPADAS